MVSEERVEKSGQKSCENTVKTEKRNWLCSRFFLMAAFLCLFVNQAAEAPGLFSVLFSAGIQAGILGAVGKRLKKGREKEKILQWESVFVALGIAGMFCAQFLLLTQAGGYPEERELWIKCWGGLPGFGEWIWNHWRMAGFAAAVCVDLSILLAVQAAGKAVRGQVDPGYREAYVGAGRFRVLFFLILLLGISPWILVPQPVLFVMPVITGLLLYAGKRLETTDGERKGNQGENRVITENESQIISENESRIAAENEDWISTKNEKQAIAKSGSRREFQDKSCVRDGSKAHTKTKGCLAGGVVVLLFLLCLVAAGLDGAGIREVFEGKSLLGLLLHWFESLKSGLSDGTFGWLSAPKLEPFTMNGQALRLQNTIYPGADRYGWYAGLVQGTWVLLLWMEAAVSVKKAGKETTFFLAAMLLLPLWQPAGSCMAAAVFLPWLAVRAGLAGELRN